MTRIDPLGECEPSLEAPPRPAPGEPPKNAPIWTTRAPVDAASANLLEVKARGFEKSEIVALWHPSEKTPPGAETQLALQGVFLPGSDEQTFRFALWSQASWIGTIPGLSLHTDPRTRGEAEFRCIRFLRRAVDPERLAAATQETWRVTLDEEQRLSLLLSPGAAARHRFRAPPGPSRFRFGFGAASGVPAAIELSLVAVDGSGTTAPIFSRRIEPADRGRWQDVEVELAAVSGSELDLEFRATSSSASPDFLFVSSPLLGTPHSGGPALDVMLVSLDTLRADRVSAYGYDLPTTPRLDRFAHERAARFETVVSQAPTTHPSHASLFSGLDAFRHNANRDAAGSGLVLLAELFRDAGYETAAFTGGAMVHPRHGLSQGFERFRYWLDTERRDTEIDAGLAQMLAWIRAPQLAPRFFFWHTYEIHSPYRKREPYFSRLHPRLEAPVGQVQVAFSQPALEDGYLAPGRADFRLHDSAVGGTRADGVAVESGLASALYDSAVAYADDRLGQLFDELERSGRLERTIVAIVSDHGESFGEHGLGFHGHLYDDNLLVPLFLAVPGREYGGRVVTGQVRLMDLMPTLLELAAQPVPVGLDAVSLLPLLEDRSTARRDAWSYAAGPNRGLSLRRSNGLKYHFNNTAWRVLFAREELYDLRTDPGELLPLKDDEPLLRKLRDEVRQVLGEHASGWRLVVANGADERLRGEISGAWIHSARVRVLGPDTQPLDPLENLAGARFDLPARSVSTWLLDGAPEGELGLRLDLPGEPRLAISPFGSETARSWILEAGSWSAVEGRLPQPGERGLGLAFSGSGGASRGTPAPADSEEMRQLVALGYLK